MFLLHSLVMIQYCGEPPWPRGSVLGLRPPGHEFRIRCLEDSVITFISPSSGGSPGPIYPICAQRWPKTPFISLVIILFTMCFASQKGLKYKHLLYFGFAKPICTAYSVGPTSSTLAQHCTNVVQMFCAHWDLLALHGSTSNHHQVNMPCFLA